MNEIRRLTADIPERMAGWRLDQALAELFDDFSRSRLQQWVKQGRVTVDGRPCKPRDKVLGGEHVVLEAVLEPHSEAPAQALELDVVHEDEHILVVNKPVGLVVHPAAGNPAGTLMNALLHHFPDSRNLPRAGIVHRLDKDTSGLMVVARTLEAHKSLIEQLQARTVSREYDAVVYGAMVAGGTVDAPIGRHPVDRKRMAVREEGGKEAITHYRVVERFPFHTHVRAKLETGRTHQIRVHMAHIRHPLVGDAVYGGRLRFPEGAGEALKTALRTFRRQALHARRLALIHPASGEEMAWEVAMPADMQKLIEALREDARQRSGGA